MNDDGLDTTPMRLRVVAERYGLTAESLRAEARRGRLTIWRVAGKDWTSHAEIAKMFDRCRVQPEADMSGQREPYFTEGDDTLAIAKARAAIEKLKSGRQPALRHKRG